MFKVGSKIELIDDFGMGADHGAMAIAEHTSQEDRDQGYVTVSWIREDERCHGQMDGEYTATMFRLVQQEWDTEENNG